MRRPITVTQFKRDIKLMQKRNKDLSKLKKLMTLLIEGQALPPEYGDHALKGNWKFYRDSHIEPDWLLLYKIDGDDIYFVRTGTHADLFGM